MAKRLQPLFSIMGGFVKKIYSLTLLSFVVVTLGFQNCSDLGANFGGTSENSSNNGLSSDAQVAKLSCHFIGREAVSSILENVLGLESGDVAMMNDAGEPLRSTNCKSFNPMNTGRECFYLAEYASELETPLCNASTFRLVSQIYINACKESLSVESNARRLFPQGSGNFSQIHLSLTGRDIKSDETSILQDLAATFTSDEEKMSAVCAAIGSSLAAINSY